MRPEVPTFARFWFWLTRAPEPVSTGYRPRRPRGMVTNLAPYYSIVREEQRITVLPKRWPPMWTQVTGWTVSVVVTIAAALIVLLAFEGRTRVAAGAVAAVPLVIGCGAMLFAVYGPNMSAGGRPALVVDRREGIIEVPLAGTMLLIDDVRAVQVAHFNLALGPASNRTHQMMRHLVLCVADEHQERYDRVLEWGYPMVKLARELAKDLGVPMEFAWTTPED